MKDSFLKKFIFILIIVYLIILILEKINIFIIFNHILCILTPIIYGCVIAFLLNPIKNYMVKKGTSPLFSTITIYIVLLLIIYLFISNIIPNFIISINKFIESFPHLLDNVLDIIKSNNIDLTKYKTDIELYITNYITNINISSECLNIISIISNILLGFVLSFYILINDKINIKKYIKKDTYNLINEISNILKNYIKATLLSSMSVFILCTIYFIIIGIDNVLVNGLICGITNIIPYIGPYIGCFFPLVGALSISTSKGIILLIGIFVIQQIEGNIINPIIMSRSINIHPIVSIIAILIFTYFLGILGMIIAIPFTASLKSIYFYIKKRYNDGGGIYE